MIYLDANVFLYALLGNDAKSEACVSILSEVTSGKVDAGTSSLTWDEFLHGLKKKIGREKAIEESKSFLHMPHLVLFKVDREILQKAQYLVETYLLDPRDSIHAATALVHGATEILSDDSDFDTVTELKRRALHT